MEVIKLRDEYIKLGQALKAANLVESGVDAKFAIQDGLVKVNGRWKPREEKNSATGTWWNLREPPLKLKNRKTGAICL